MGFFDKHEKKQFSSTDMSIYNFILSNYERVPQMRVRDIAKEVHASASSVMRFVHKMGYNSFPEFRVSLKKEIAGEFAEKTLSYWERVEKSLTKTSFAADLSENIRILSDKIIQAENIVFLGIGISGILSSYGARRLATLGFNSFEVTDSYYPLQPRLHNTTDNIIIIISNSGETPDLIDMVAYYQPKQDFYLVCITGNANSTLARMSQMILKHETAEPRKYGFYDNSSQLPTMFILEKLIDEIENHPEVSPNAEVT